MSPPKPERSGATPSCEVVVTRSGARAMLDRSTGEVMHPVIGPLVEAEQLYVAPSRLAERLSVAHAAPLTLFDVGLGAGSNAAQAWRTSERRPAPGGRRLSIVSFESSLSAFALALEEEHRASFGFDDDVFQAARALLSTGAYETERTSWRLMLGDLLDALPREPPESADVIFWDPFSPRANPSLWTTAAFRSMRARCAPGATLHTYSGSTAVRSALLLAGFAVGQGPATGEKTQTTIAAVDPRDLDRPLDARWLDRLARSSVPWPADAPEDALAQVRALPQFQ